MPDWGHLSDIGQAVGALLSGAALVGVVLSLRLQRRQTQVAAFEALRNVRMQLLQFAIDKPRFLRLWGYGIPPEEDAQETAYISMIFAYLKMAFALRVLTENELVGFCRVFVDPAMVAFWERARENYLNDPFSRESRHFAQIVEREYRRVTQASAAKETVSPPSGP